MNKDYAVKCEIDHGELYLSITHNGHQWASVAIKDREWEIPLIISELQRHLTRHSSGQAKTCRFCDDVVWDTALGICWFHQKNPPAGD